MLELNKNEIKDWEITGSIIKDKFNLNIYYEGGTCQTITDTLTKLITIKDKFL